MSNLRGKTAIVTGGAVRLGRELALSLAREGVNLCLHYGNSEQAARETLHDVRQFGVQAEIVQAEFSRPVSAAKRISGLVLEQFGRADYLINSAAIFESGTLESTDESHWDRHFAINLKAPFFLTQEFSRLIGSAGEGSRSVVNIADWRGSAPVPGHLAYTMTKAALIAQTRILAQELGPLIRVNAVAPGAILPAPGVSLESFEARGSCNPLQRTGSPHDVCEAVIFLLKSEFITGEILHVSGGEQLAPGNRSSSPAGDL